MDKLVSVSEASRQLGISLPTLLKLIRGGRLPSYRVGDLPRVSVAELREAFRVKADQAE